jgi:hypothetical protein
MTNGFLNTPGLPPSSGIAAALQNVLQAGQSSSMQQVIFAYALLYSFSPFVVIIIVRGLLLHLFLSNFKVRPSQLFLHLCTFQMAL